jgi:hypothetical protein
MSRVPGEKHLFNRKRDRKRDAGGYKTNHWETRQYKKMLFNVNNKGNDIVPVQCLLKK